MKRYLVSAFILILATSTVFADDQSEEKLAENGIVSTDASGDSQMTVIDANGNLKMVPKNSDTKNNTSSATNQQQAASPAATPPEVQGPPGKGRIATPKQPGNGSGAVNPSDPANVPTQSGVVSPAQPSPPPPNMTK